MRSGCENFFPKDPKFPRKIGDDLEHASLNPLMVFRNRDTFKWILSFYLLSTLVFALIAIYTAHQCEDIPILEPILKPILEPIIYIFLILVILLLFREGIFSILSGIFKKIRNKNSQEIKNKK
ncbi:MAG: hypothetical protein PVF58_10510 [Candidatus Methanofastidiosia archaeon]|jgi:hypothetical protein